MASKSKRDRSTLTFNSTGEFSFITGTLSVKTFAKSSLLKWEYKPEITKDGKIKLDLYKHDTLITGIAGNRVLKENWTKYLYYRFRAPLVRRQQIARGLV